MIAIIDYGMGNVASIYNMLDHLNIEAMITHDRETILQASHLILPGVGAFDAAMTILEETKLKQVILDFVASGKPLLGICLGMQLLGLSSEEGTKQGLGLIDFVNRRFPAIELADLRIPHMGWNLVTPVGQDEILDSLLPESRFYFVHSYYADNVPVENQWMTCEYGITFTAAVKKNKIFGTQFHPEKSHAFGMKLLEAFARVQ